MFWNKAGKAAEEARVKAANASVPLASLADKSFSVFNYPKQQYGVYWETVESFLEEKGWSAEVRFIGYADFPHRSSYTIPATSKEELDVLTQKFISEKMNEFRR